MSAIKSRILIADPDPDISRTMAVYFELKHHEVQLVNTAAAIMSAARQWQPNAILVSTEFTDANPYHTCQHLLEDTRTAHIPIIMLLHLADRKTRLNALEVGVDDVVSKPLDLEELWLRVEAAVRLSTMRVHA